MRTSRHANTTHPSLVYNTPITVYACFKSPLSCMLIQLCLSAGMPVDCRCNYRSLLVLATRCMHIPVIRLLLRSGADVNVSRSIRSDYVLKSNDDTVLDLLIAAGADVNVQSDFGGGAALETAMWHSRISVVSKLIAAGAEITPVIIRAALRTNAFRAEKIEVLRENNVALDLYK